MGHRIRVPDPVAATLDRLVDALRSLCRSEALTASATNAVLEAALGRAPGSKPPSDTAPLLPKAGPGR